MKLKKFLIICLFSLLFIVNVNAATQRNIFYSNDTIDIINNYSSLFDNISNYITNNAQSLSNNNIDFVNDKTILAYSTDQDFSSGNISIYALANSRNVEFGNYGTSILDFAYSVCNVSFDTTNFSINNLTCSSGLTGHSLNLYIYFNSGIPLFFDWRLGKNNENYFINYSSYDINLNNDSMIVETNSQIPLNQFTNALNKDLIPEPLNPNKCISYDIGGQIGEVRNAKAISFRVRDYSNALNYPIEGYFRLVSPQFNDVMIPINDYLDIKIEPGPDNEGDYSFNYDVYWVNENNETIDDLINPRYAIYFDYELIAEDDIDTYLDVIITLSIKNTIPANNLTFFDKPVDIYANIYNCNFDLISYGYKDNDNIVHSSSDSVLNNYLQNYSLPSLKFFNNLNDILPPGPVDSILTLPLEMLNSIKNSLSGNCEPLQVTLPYLNRNIELKCMNSFYENVGVTLFFNSVGFVASILMLISYFTFLYNWIDNTLRLGHHKLKTWGTGGV